MNLPSALAVVTALTLPVLTTAAVYHVAPNNPAASDDNPGTEDQPWLTIAKAASLAVAGDTVYLHEGRYRESVKIANPGTASAPILFAAYGDDTVILDGTDIITPDQWTKVEGFTNVFAIPLQRDPGQIFVDDKPVYMKLDKIADFQWRLGKLTDDDVGLWQYDGDNKRLLFNLGGGNPSETHRIRVPVRATAFALSPYSRLRGIHVTGYSAVAIELAEDAVVEDCVVTDCGFGIRVAGWNKRGAIIRRNTVIGTLNNGIFLQDRPTGCLIEDNLVVRCTLNPWHDVLWAGSVKMNSASDSVFAHNVVLEAGNPDTINGWDGWALWGDINIVRVMYVGNTCAHNEDAGLYLEYAMGETRAYFNTSYRDGHGITCRASQRGVFMHNYIQSSRSSGLAVWAAADPFPTIDNVFAHNLVRDCNPSLRLQVEHPQFCDYNIYWPRDGAPLADGEKGRKFSTLDELRDATNHELHGEVRDAQPEDVGLDVVTFRVPDATNADEVLMMVGNGGCEFEDPVGVNLLPYFWRASTGDGVERLFVYAAYTGLPGGVDTFAYGGGGATVALRADTENDKFAHSGRRCLEVNGFRPDRMPPEGTGFNTPVLPARPGDTIDVTFWVRGKQLEPTQATALAAFAEFTNQTGQRRVVQRLAIEEPLRGTFDWRQLKASVTVPDTARRVSFFFGMSPATGTIWFDDLTIRVR